MEYKDLCLSPVYSVYPLNFIAFLNVNLICELLELDLVITEVPPNVSVQNYRSDFTSK